MINYRELLVRCAQEVEEAPRALTPTQLRNKQSREAWRERWAKHHAEMAFNLDDSGTWPALARRQCA